MAGKFRLHAHATVTHINARKEGPDDDKVLAAVRAGAGRADLLAVVPVGVARRGAEWRGSNPMGKGD